MIYLYECAEKMRRRGCATIVQRMVSRNAIFAVRNIINYFNEHGSNVFMAFLDTSKANDRVNHFRLNTLVMNRNVPAAFLNILMN